MCTFAGVCGEQPEVSGASRAGTEQQAISHSSWDWDEGHGECGHKVSELWVGGPAGVPALLPAALCVGGLGAVWVHVHHMLQSRLHHIRLCVSTYAHTLPAAHTASEHAQHDLMLTPAITITIFICLLILSSFYTNSLACVIVFLLFLPVLYPKCPCVNIYFFSSVALLSPFCFRMRGFWARPCKGWNWQAGKWATVSRREEGGRVFKYRQHTHQNAGSESHSSRMSAVINCTAIQFCIIYNWIKGFWDIAFSLFCLDFSGFSTLDWLW